jgi:mannose-6-phosphate isomerase
MSELYPLLMRPLFDPRPWGRFNLSPIYAKTFSDKIGESWLTGDNCVVANGCFAGRLLGELAAELKRSLVGDAPRDDNRFPLLLKFLFPQEKLSVQVHPDDEAAHSLGEPCGKTECWYVAHAEPGAEIGLGLKPGVTRSEFERSIHENRAEDLLNWIKVFAGDMIYVAGGTVHTLGPGSIIVETQQQSDTTFRLYDYGRPRELHLEHGLRVIKDQVSSGKVRPMAGSPLEGNGNRLQPLINSTYFTVQKFDIDSAQHFVAPEGKSSAQILVATEGRAAIRSEAGPVEFAKGGAVVIPASLAEFAVEPSPTVQFIKAYVPGISVPEPETSLR